LSQINAGDGQRANLRPTKEDQMPLHDIAILALIVGVFSVFGLALAFASWDETRGRKNRK